MTEDLDGWATRVKLFDEAKEALRTSKWTTKALNETAAAVDRTGFRAELGIPAGLASSAKYAHLSLFDIVLLPHYVCPRICTLKLRMIFCRPCG